MINMDAARTLKTAVEVGYARMGLTKVLEAAAALIESIEEEYGSLLDDADEEDPVADPSDLSKMSPYIQEGTDMMPLGAAIQHSLRHADASSCGREHEQLAKWLEELQARRNRDLHDPEYAEIQSHMDKGHTEHCAKRQVWGDGKCECPLGTLARPQTIAQWQKVIHQYAKDKGWWDKPRNIGDIFILFTSEVSEAYEEYRGGRGLTETYLGEGGKPEGVPTELADVIIRVFDFCEWAGIDLQAIMEQKHTFNLTRSYRHGNKLT